MENKQNFGIKIDLLKLKGAFMRNLTGKTVTKCCIIIPVDDNPNIFLGEKGCYLNSVAYEINNPKHADTHCLMPDLPKEVREQMTEELRNALPIIGNMRPIKPAQMQVNGNMSMDTPEGQVDNDLPF